MAYKKMEPKYKKIWVEALESGKYRQATGQLKVQLGERNYSYCCLGVAKRVCLKTPNAQIVSAALPDDDAEKLGLSCVVEDKLITMNDADGKNFKEIATWIRKNL